MIFFRCFRRVASLLGVLLLAAPWAAQTDAVAPPDQDGLVKTGTAADVAAARAADAERAKQKWSLAVLPFVGKTEAEKTLAEQMRFAVAQKMSRDGRFVRQDNVEVDSAVSALQIPWEEKPSAEDLQKVFELLDQDLVVLGRVEKRRLTLWLYENGKLKKEAVGTIPDGKESPRQTVEKMLAELAEMRFVGRDVEADHSDPATEKRWTERPNLAPDPLFRSDKNRAAADRWWGLLGAKEWHPPVLTLGEAEKLGSDQVAVVPKAAAGVAGGPETQSGYCLMMRLSQATAEANGLACMSDWIAVEDGQKYRFAVRYHSTGPVPRLFIKGFAQDPDQFGDRNDPEAARREYYRAQILPRQRNAGWDLIDMDFTPQALAKFKDRKIAWVRVDLYIYLKPGDVFFDQVVVKKLSP